MKPFDLELAKQGHPVETRDGHKARIICFDRLVRHQFEQSPIVALIGDGLDEVVYSYNNNGVCIEGNLVSKNIDLVMAPVRHEGWIAILRDNYKGGISVDGVYNTEKEAREDGEAYRSFTLIAVQKIEWTE